MNERDQEMINMVCLIIGAANVNSIEIAEINVFEGTVLNDILKKRAEISRLS